MRMKYNTMDFHRNQSNVSLEQYIREKRVQLGIEVTSKYRVYLDLRFWILFREIELGRSDKQDQILLLNKIKYLVDNGDVICPISETIYIELMKQSDNETRLATAKLIDHLSLGVTLIANDERISQELCNSIYSQGGAKHLIPIDHLVWTKLSYTLGETHPNPILFEPSEALVIQKSFFDHMWNITLIEMINYYGSDSGESSDVQKTADLLNLGNENFSDDIRSYEQAYRTEFEGGLSLFKEKLLQLFKESVDAGFMDFEANNNNLSDKERFRKFSKSIRTLHIGACCYAAVRWDKKRKLKGNDLLDFHHAEAALGYCNLFLTEKPLKDLVSQKHLGLLNDFSCAVESSAIGGLRVLNSRKY